MERDPKMMAVIKYFFLFLGKNCVPGPGSYNLPSVFDKKRKMKVPLN
jgi:hypothetical protein